MHEGLKMILDSGYKFIGHDDTGQSIYALKKESSFAYVIIKFNSKGEPINLTGLINGKVFKDVNA